MGDTLRPETADQLLDTVKWAVAEKTPLEVVAGGSKRGFGRPMQTAAALDMTGLTGITAYEPEELFMTAKAGTPMAEIDAALGEAGQQLSFEPPDYGALLGGDAGQATIGGIVAANVSGPRRVKEGAARDHLLGFNAVSGRGEVFKSGGTVVKNVTGFDLSKLMAGSFGTLAVMSDVTLKVLPAPEKIRTLLIRWKVDGVYDHGAIKVMAEALGSPHDVSGAAHLPSAVAQRSDVERVNVSSGGVTAIRVEGPAPSVAHRTGALRDLISDYGEIEELHTQNSATFWQEVRDVVPFTGRDDLPILWRLSVPPASGAKIALRILEETHGEVMYDWGGGLVWLALKSGDDTGADAIRSEIAADGGHATLIRAPEHLRQSVAVFQPLSSPEMTVNRNIKEGFDPNGVLNPGRMYDGV